MKNIQVKILFLIIILFPLGTYALFDNWGFFQIKDLGKNKDVNIKILFTGDIFLDRGVDSTSQKSVLKYAYPFSGLSTFKKSDYNLWVGNLECPVTDAQSTQREKEVYLKFSCKKEYLPELAKYFDIVSLANNHTDNMGKIDGITETRKHLDDAGIKYFGDYDSGAKGNVCKIIFSSIDGNHIPIAYCGFHGVFKLPTDKELSIINDYSKYFITFVMPHQGVEYAPKSNTYQKMIYKKMIDQGADAVIGSHPHVIEEVEQYKNKLIFYSLGNFIFDQTDKVTRQHMEVETQISFPEYNNNYKNLNCANLTNLDCLKMATDLKIQKPNFTLKYKPIFSSSGLDFITKKLELTDKEYNLKLKNIGFDRVASTSKIQ